MTARHIYFPISGICRYCGVGELEPKALLACTMHPPKAPAMPLSDDLETKIAVLYRQGVRTAEIATIVGRPFGTVCTVVHRLTIRGQLVGRNRRRSG